MLGSENKENIDRREFIITLVLSITSVLLAACTRILGKTQEYEIRYPPTASKSPPTPTANKTDTVVVETATPTTHKTDTVVAETSTPVADDCKQWEEERPDSDGKDRSNTKLAETRSCNEITYAIIHHSQEEGAEGYSCLVRKAQKYDYIHSYRVYNDDGVIDARFTMGEKGYKWISYHFLIGRDGLCLAVQNPKYVRVHAQNDDVNRRSIAICLDGDFRPREQKAPLDLKTSRLAETKMCHLFDQYLRQSLHLYNLYEGSTLKPSSHKLADNEFHQYLERMGLFSKTFYSGISLSFSFSFLGLLCPRAKLVNVEGASCQQIQHTQ